MVDYRKIPCQADCKERNAYCRSTCERYVEYRAYIDSQKETINEAKAENKVFYTYKHDKMTKELKRH